MTDTSTDEQKERFPKRDLIDSLPQIVFEVDATGRLTYVNRFALSFTGFTMDDLAKGLSCFDMLIPEDRTRAAENFSRIMAGKSFGGREYTLLRKDGTTCPVLIRTVPTDPTNPRDGARGVVMDLIGLSAARQELERKNSLLAAIVEIQKLFISRENPSSVFVRLLEHLLTLTSSQFGFIGEVCTDSEGGLFLTARTFLDPSGLNDHWRSGTTEPTEDAADLGIFTQFSSEVIATRKVVIANRISLDPRWGGLLQGDPPVVSFLGLPLHAGHELVGVVGVANRPEGYDGNLAVFLQPYCAVVGNIINACRVETARQTLERSLRQSRETFRSLIDCAGDAVFVHDAFGRIVDTNRQASRALGYSREELLGMNIGEIEEGLSRDELEMIWPGIVPHHAVTLDGQHRRKDGSSFPVEIRLSLIPESDPPLMVALARDVSDRRRAELALAENEARYRALVESSKAVAWEVDLATRRFTYIGPRVKDLLGRGIEAWPDLDAWAAAIHPDDRAEALRACLDHENDSSDRDFLCRFMGMDGTVVWIQNIVSVMVRDGRPVSLKGHMVDISGLKRQEQEISRIRNLEAIGHLAGGIAHDFNNLLTVIFGNVDLARGDCAPGSQARLCLDRTMSSIDRARELTGQLITFSPGGSLMRAQEDLGRIARKSGAILFGGTDIAFTLDLADGLWPVLIDRRQMELVFSHLFRNGLEAVPPGRGQVLCRIENVELRNSHAGPLAAGRYIKIVIADNGLGISSHHLPSVFDPYFSTKSRGERKGMGLGLTICHSILSRHHGRIEIDSEEGRGTTVTLILPAAVQMDLPPPEPSPSRCGGKPKSRKKKFRILVMDDDPTMNEMLAAMLEDGGFRCTVVKRGEDAVAAWNDLAGTRDAYDLAILDLFVQQGMGGLETLMRLRRITPDARAIVTSGYTDDPILLDCKDYGFAGALAKPFSRAALLDVIDSVLTGG